MRKTFFEETQRAHEAWLDLLYEVGKQSGLFRLIKKISFLELKGWVKEREARERMP